MTREEAIEVLEKMKYPQKVNKNGWVISNVNIENEALEMAISALEQEPICDRDCEHCTWTECPIEPCDDTVSIRKDVLKCRVGKLVAYNVEWLKKHWQMEMDIVCGVKPCDDAISRDAVDKYIARLLSGYLYDGERERLEIFSAYLWELPSVTPSRRKGHWTNNQNGTYECDKCGCKHSRSKYCPNCGANMVEPQERSDKE